MGDNFVTLNIVLIDIHSKDHFSPTKDIFLSQMVIVLYFSLHLLLLA